MRYLGVNSVSVVQIWSRTFSIFTLLPDQVIFGKTSSAFSQSRYNEGVWDNHQASHTVSPMSKVTKNNLWKQYQNHLNSFTKPYINNEKNFLNRDFSFTGIFTVSASEELMRTTRRWEVIIIKWNKYTKQMQYSNSRWKKQRKYTHIINFKLTYKYNKFKNN